MEFVRALPVSVVEHAEGQSTVQQIMALLQKLDAAAQTAAAQEAAAAPPAEGAAAAAAATLAPPGPAAAATVASPGPIPHDEDDEEMAFFDVMAETAVPASEGDADPELRKAKVAEMRERLSASRPDLRHIRKTCKK